MNTNAVRAACLLLMMVCLGGCNQGPGIAPVTGRVTLGGEPLGQGKVDFLSQEFGASALLESDGSFRLQSQHGNGVPPATYKVSIAPKPLSDAEVVAALKASSTSAAPIAQAADIPAMYRNPATSGFTAEVTPGGKNHFEFEMKKAP